MCLQRFVFVDTVITQRFIEKMEFTVASFSR